MKTRRKYVLTFLAIGLIGICLFVPLIFAKEVKIDAAKPPFTFQNFSTGALAKDIKIEGGSKAEKRIMDWLAANSKGWRATPITYVPNQLISGKDISLNFMKGSVILNFNPPEKTKNSGQYRRAITKSDSEFLDELAKILGS